MNKLFSNARTTEVDDTSDRLLLAYNAQTGLASDAFLKTIFDDIHSLSDQITDAIKRDLVFSEMEDADENVAIALRSVFTVLKGYEAMPLVQLSTAAKVLTPVADKYTLSILRLNYAAQSSNVEALLMDLSAPALKASIDVLPGVAEAIANLRAAQTAFIEKRVDYEKAMALKTAGTPASELKKPPTSVVHRITLRLATEAYGDFCVAAMIDSLFLEGKRKSFDNQTHIPSDYVIILNPMSPQQFLMLVNCKFITFN